MELSVGKGEFFGILGPNGAGKSTLFKVLATLVEPDEGTARVAGHDVQRRGQAVRARLGDTISNERSLYWRLSARQNLELFAALRGLRGREKDRRVEEILDVVGLDDAGRKLVGQFSSGMKQRLLLARALIHRPEVLLLDEPTVSLDPLASRELRSFLREAVGDRLGCTVLLATHDSEEAFGLCDRVAVLDRGTVRAVGPAEDLLAAHCRDRYTIRLQGLTIGQLRRMERAGTFRRLELIQNGDDWTVMHVEVPGRLDGTARVLDELAAAGASVARCERRSVPLAELLEEIVADGSGEGR